MVAMTAGELSPIVNGFVYCGVILGCRTAYEPRRAQEWTAALTRWCEQQPDMVSFTGTCMVHRAEIMQLHGAWPEALQEARRAGQRCQLATNEAMAAEAVYREGEVHRLRGEHAAAEQAYRTARRGGREPQPGLALLRLAQGRPDAASAAIRRVLAETAEPAVPRRAVARLRRDHARGRLTPRRRATPPESSRRSASAGRATCSTRWWPMPGEPSRWHRVTRARR
jgi:hypothetical protein